MGDDVKKKETKIEKKDEFGDVIVPMEKRREYKIFIKNLDLT
ncbi:MAG: hypothetical protein ACM3ZS_02565 [Nitrososphaerota archaeon]|jgi:hypothetical protein